MTHYKNLEVWKKSMALVKAIYDLTKAFPKEEQYGITAQIRRAAVSIPCNVAEGSGRQYKKDNIQFLHVSRGSIYEVETLLNIAVMIEIISEETFLSITPQVDECLKILNGYIKYMENAKIK